MASDMGADPVVMGADAVGLRVGQLIEQAADRSEFLKALASEMVVSFQTGIVAVHTSDWTNPMMLVVDDHLSQQIERSALVDLLETATRSPIACSIPRTDGQSSNRGIRIELTQLPSRSTLLLIYPSDQTPSASRQIQDLQRLGNFAESSRQLIETLPPAKGTANDSSSENSTASNNHALITSDLSKSSNDDRLMMSQQRSLRSFHTDLDLNATGYRIANESRRMLQCDRVTVLIPRKGRYKVIAVSGVAVVDRRSNIVQSVERLVRSAVVLSRPLVVPTTQPLPPQIQQPLDDYLDESGVMSAIILPLHGKADPKADPSGRDVDTDHELDVDPFGSDGDLVGVMVLEYFSGNSPSGIGTAMTTVASEATLALANSSEHRNVFGLSLWKAVGTGLSKTKAPVAGMLGIFAVGLIAAASLVQVDHHVIATGKVEPTIRREVFASLDGVVKELHVADGQSVQRGDLLLTLQSSDLESQAESLAGEIQTASERLAAMFAVRLSETDRDSSSTRSSSSRLAMEERQLKSELANLQQQEDIVRAQMKNLSIIAPIDGTVVGWQIERRLLDRPVGRGNLLISIVDESGPWSLKLNIPDEDAGPIIESNLATGKSEIEFAVATLPSSTFQANMQSISTAARMDSRGQHVIDAQASVAIDSNSNTSDNSFDTFDPSMMRSGADVTAKIKCGRRSILRSWFGDVFDFVHRNILFYF